MFALFLLCAFWSLLQAAASRSLPARTDSTAAIVVPVLISDFAKNDVSAQWASGYPKEWGSEDFHYQFSVPDPEDCFNGVVTEDEKHLVMFNGTHVTFIDLETNSTVSTFRIKIPENILALGLTIRSVPQGGYDLLVNVAPNRYDYPSMTIRTRLSPDLKLVGDPTHYQGGIGSISKQGRIATTYGYIYDLESSNDTSVVMEGQPHITDLSFSPDGVHLASVSWQKATADLWNATSGKKIFEFPATNVENWVTRFSPDGKYIAISLGSGKNSIQVYSLDDLATEPTVLQSFNFWIRAVEWSPDSKYIATGDKQRMQVWKMPEAQVVQTWEVEGTFNSVFELSGLTWLDDGNKISWMFREGRYMYDFQKNVKWWWTLRAIDHTWSDGGVSYLKKKGMVVTEDGDSTMRFWKV